MKVSMLVVVAVSFFLTASAQQIYNDGPINGQETGWPINFGLFVGDSFTVSGGTSSVNGMSFGAWLFPGDVLQSVEVLIESDPLGGTIYFDQDLSFTASGCESHGGFNVCTENAMFNGPTLNNGTYWLILQNASVPSGDPVYWDNNGGVGCTSPGCPSQTLVPEGTIPAESFTVLGSPVQSTTPESTGIVLFGTGAAACIATLRRRYLGR
jgi:hypothetical protein